MSELKHVLVVDDNRDSADMLAIVLRHHGHNVQVAYSGPTALEVAREQRPSVILLDLGMPSMDGYTVARHLRDQPETKNALIVAVTGYGLAGDRARRSPQESTCTSSSLSKTMNFWTFCGRPPDSSA